MGYPIIIHWDIKKYMKGMSAGDKGSRMARLHVLVYLMASANQRYRCWPSIPRMADETGISASTINEAKEWLIEHKALAIVPFEKREGKELKVSHRQNVYQLTGVIEIEGTIYPYILMNDEIKAAIEEELKDLNFSLNVNSDRSEFDRLESDNEVIPVLEVDTSINYSASKDDAEKSTENPLPATPKPKGAKAPDPWYDNILAVWGLREGGNGDMRKFLEGRAIKKGWKEYNPPPGYTLTNAEEICSFARWYHQTKQGGKQGLSMVAERGKLQSAIMEWVDAGRPSAQPQAFTSERVFE